MTDFEDKKKNDQNSTAEEDMIKDQGEKGGMAEYDADVDLDETSESNEPAEADITSDDRL